MTLLAKQKFYYDHEWQACFAYKYNGNDSNRFDSRQQCEQACMAGIFIRFIILHGLNHINVDFLTAMSVNQRKKFSLAPNSKIRRIFS